MEYYNNILTISHAELTDGVISKSKYIALQRKDGDKPPVINVVRRGCYGTTALIAFDSLPTRIKNACIEKYGNPRENAVENSFTKYIVEDYAAIQFFQKHELVDKTNLKREFQEQYVANAMVLNAIRQLMNDRKALQKALGGKVNTWGKLSELIQQLSNKLGCDLPANPRKLQAKYNDYIKFGYEILVSRKFKNSNASKVTDMEQEALLRVLFGKHNNLDNEQICSLYNIVAERTDWDKISATTIANYREKWNLRTIGSRKGETSFDNTKAMLIKRSAPVLPLVYWTADGWDAELLYQKTEIDKNGNTITTYHNRLTIVVVLDPCCKYPIGYAIGTHETPALIREAFRNAANHTAELFGQRHSVHQLQTDNYGRGKLTPMYEGISKHFTPARVHNAKAKVIEPYFKYLNKKYCQLMANWSGFGVTSKKESQPNSQYLNKIRHTFPDEFGVRMQLERIIQMERSGKINKYCEAYNHLPVEDRLLMSNQEFLLHLGEEKTETNKLSASGLVVTLLGEKKQYDSFDIRFREHASENWTVRFDPSDTTTILALNDDKTLRFELTAKHIQPMALYDRKDGDSEQLALVTGFNKQMKSNILEGMKQDHQLVEHLFNQNPQLSDTLTKLVLVDSNGQHKDNKSAARLGEAQKVLAKQNKKALKEVEKSWQQEQEEYLNAKLDINKYL